MGNVRAPVDPRLKKDLDEMLELDKEQSYYKTFANDELFARITKLR